MEFLPINTFQEIESIFQNDEENQNQRKMADTYRKLRIQNQKTKQFQSLGIENMTYEQRLSQIKQEQQRYQSLVKNNEKPNSLTNSIKISDMLVTPSSKSQRAKFDIVQPSP